MASDAVLNPATDAAAESESWLTVIAIALGQALISFNVASLLVAIGRMVHSFNVPPTTVVTGIVMYSLAVAGLVMLGAKLNQRYGSLHVFRTVVVLFGFAQVLMTFSPTATVMLIAQLLSGMAVAALVPSLVALIANNYHGSQQATALGSARAGAGVAAFLIGGILGTFIGWRPAFGILIVLSAMVFALSFPLKPDQGRSDVQIDVADVVLAAAAIILISRTPIETASAMLPFNLSVFFSAMLIVRCYQLLTPRQIGRLGFITCTIALLWLAFVVHNDWSAVAVLVGLVVFGIGQGSLVTASPKELAGDVGSLRGTANNLAAAVGTAVVGALLVGLLSAAVLRNIADSPLLPLEIQSEVDLDSINFISNDRLLGIMQRTSATPEQVVESVRINTDARLGALRMGLLIMAGLALLAMVPAGRLPDYKPGEIPANPPPPRRGGTKTVPAG